MAMQLTARDRLRAQAAAVQQQQEQTRQQTAQEHGMKDRMREEEALRQENARAQAARDRRTPDAGTEQVNRTPMQDRARMTREKSAYQLGDIRNESGRVGKAVQSIGLNTMGSVQFMGDTLKQSRDNAEAYQKSGLQDKANQALEQIRLAKALHGEGSPEHLQAQKDYDDLRRTIMQWNSEPNKAVKQDTLGYRMLEESGRLQEEALEGTEGAGRFLGEAAISIADNLGTVLATGGNPAASATLMGAKAAAGKAKELTDRGVSASEALVRGTVSGSIEAATEKIPLDNMLDVVKSGGQSALKNILKQAGVEGMEEGFSYLFNYLSDKAARDPEAVFSPEELLEQIASGAFSGLVFGAGGTAVNRMAAAEAPEVIGQTWKERKAPAETSLHTQDGQVRGLPMLTAEERETGIIRETGQKANTQNIKTTEKKNQFTVKTDYERLLVDDPSPSFEKVREMLLHGDLRSSFEEATGVKLPAFVEDAYPIIKETMRKADMDPFSFENEKRERNIRELESKLEEAENNAQTAKGFEFVNARMIVDTYQRKLREARLEFLQARKSQIEQLPAIREKQLQAANERKNRSASFRDTVGGSMRADFVSGLLDEAKKAAGNLEPVDMPMHGQGKNSQIDTSKPVGAPRGESGDKMEISPHRGRGGTDVPAFSLVDGADSKYRIAQKVKNVKPVDMPMLTAEERETGIIRQDKPREAAMSSGDRYTVTEKQEKNAGTDAVKVDAGEKMHAEWAFDGGRVVANEELDRLQVIFEKKPGEELRKELRGKGFLYAPSQKAWQRKLTDNAYSAAGGIAGIQPSTGESVAELQKKALREYGDRKRRELMEKFREADETRQQNIQTEEQNDVKAENVPEENAKNQAGDLAKQGIGTALEASLTGAETLGQKEQRTGSPLPSVVESQLEALAAMMPDYQEDLMDTAETIRKYQGEEAALAFLKQQREGQKQEAGAEQNLRPTPENSGAVTDEQGNVVGTRATQKIGLKVESPIADMTAVQKAREAQWGLDVTQKQIREAEKRTRASAAEKRMAERIAKGEDSLDSFVYGWDGKDNRRRTVVEELSALYRLRDTYDAKAVKSLGKRNRDLFIDTLNREVLNRMDQAKPPKAASLHTNTWERNNLRTWGRELGQKVNQLLFDPVKQNEAQRIRWLNDQAEEMAFLSQLTERENEAVFQMLDDGRSADSFGGDVRRDLVQKAADKLRKKYSDYYDAINDVLVAHGYEEIGFIKNYTPHMQEEQMRKAMSIFERLGISEQVAELPTELAGRTDMFRPGKKWDPHFLHRTGEKSAMDAVGGFLSYANYMSEVLHHVDDIQKLRTFSDQIRYEYADEGLRADYDTIRESTDMTQEQKDAELEKLRDRKDNNSKMGAYVTALDNYTNILAGKQTQLDRAVETAIGRKGLNLIQKPIQTLVKSSIPGNLSSAINQTVQLPWLTAEAGEGNVIQAVYELARGKLKKEGFVRESDFLTGKRGAEALQKLKQKTAGEKILDAASIPFEAVDDAASQVIVRAFYLKNVKAGMDHKAALQQADAQAERLVGSRMKGAKANIFSDKSLKLLTTFQLEVANQYEHLKHDLPQEIREIERTRGKGAAAAEASKRILKGSVYAAVLNGIIKSITGNEPVGFDIIGTVWNYIRAGLPEDDEEEQGFDWTAGLEDVRDSVLDDVPYVSTIATLLGWDNGRLPIPEGDFKNIKEGTKKIFAAEDDAGKDAGIRQLLTGVLKTAAAVTPMGNQVRKTIEGGETAIRGGRYSADGTQLLYEVEKSPQNIARGLLFGRSALPETDAYYEKGGKPVLSKDQTGMMEQAAGYGVDQGTYVRFIQEAKKLKSDKDEAGETVTGSLERKKIALLDGMDLDGKQKLNLYLDNVASDSRKEDVEALQAAGMTWEEIAPALDTYLGLSGSEGSASEKATKLAAWADENLTADQAAAVKDQLDYWQMMRGEASTYEKLTGAGMSTDKASAVYDLYQSLEPEEGKTTVSESQKLRAVAGSRDLSEEDKRKAVAAMLSDTALDKFNTCVKAGVNVSSYVGVKEYYGSTSADKDAKGKTVSGSKQKKVVAYINGLPISEGQKDALYLVYYQPSGLKDTPWNNGIVGLPVLPEAERKSPLELPNVEEPAWKTVLNLP